MKTSLKTILTSLALAAALLCTPSLKAQIFTFHVDINTSSLVGSPDGPFYLDFQLNQGGATTPSNTATISNFSFTGGSASGATNVFGTATGDMGSSITLTDSSASPFNEIFQGFSAGTTDIQFDVTLTQNMAGVTPDGFEVAVLDGSTFQIPTNAPDQLSLVVVPIGNSNHPGDIGTYSTGPGGVSAIATTPEPSTWVLLLVGATAFGVLHLCRRNA